MDSVSFRVIYQDEELIAIDKPAGFHVHPPEDFQHKIAASVNCLSLLRDQVGRYLYPVHRLDRATSGVLLFAFSSESARSLSLLFQDHQINKIYYCVVRGWTPEEGVLDASLKSEHDPEVRLEAVTAFQRLGKIELQASVGKFPTSRYSLLRVRPQSGRKHQIRRHLDGFSHPIVGDTVYGRGEHNRFFRESLNIPGLLLKAYSLDFAHPRTQGEVRFVSRWGGVWHRVFDLFGVCPFEKGFSRE